MRGANQVVHAIIYDAVEDGISWCKIYPSEFDRNIAFEILLEDIMETGYPDLLRKVVLDITINMVNEQLELEL